MRKMPELSKCCKARYIELLGLIDGDIYFFVCPKCHKWHILKENMKNDKQKTRVFEIGRDVRAY